MKPEEYDLLLAGVKDLVWRGHLTKKDEERVRDFERVRDRYFESLLSGSYFFPLTGKK